MSELREAALRITEALQGDGLIKPDNASYVQDRVERLLAAPAMAAEVLTPLGTCEIGEETPHGKKDDCVNWRALAAPAVAETEALTNEAIAIVKLNAIVKHLNMILGRDAITLLEAVADVEKAAEWARLHIERRGQENDELRISLERYVSAAPAAQAPQVAETGGADWGLEDEFDAKYEVLEERIRIKKAVVELHTAIKWVLEWEEDYRKLNNLGKNPPMVFTHLAKSLNAVMSQNSALLETRQNSLVEEADLKLPIVCSVCMQKTYGDKCNRPDCPVVERNEA